MPQILAQFETRDFQSGIWALSHCATLPYSAFAKGTVNCAFAKNDFRYNVPVFSATEGEHATRAKRRHSTTFIDTVLLPMSCLCCQNCIVFHSSWYTCVTSICIQVIGPNLKFFTIIWRIYGRISIMLLHLHFAVQWFCF